MSNAGFSPERRDAEARKIHLMWPETREKYFQLRRNLSHVEPTASLSETVLPNLNFTGQDFLEDPHGTREDNGDDLLFVLLDTFAEEYSDYRRQHPQENIIPYIKHYIIAANQPFFETMSQRQKNEFAVDMVEFLYHFEPNETADACMADILKVNASQQKNIRRVLMLRAMEPSYDTLAFNPQPIGTDSDSVRKLITYHPEFVQEEEVNTAAVKAFIAELEYDRLNSPGVTHHAHRYVDMGFISQEELYTNPVLVDAVTSKYLRDISQAKISSLKDIKANYLPPGSDLDQSEQVRAAIEAAVTNVLETDPQGIKELLDMHPHFGIYSLPEFQDQVYRFFVHHLRSDNLSQAISFLEVFPEVINPRIQNQNIWGSELGKDLSITIINAIRQGTADEVENAVQAVARWGLPSELQDETNLTTEICNALRRILTRGHFYVDSAISLNSIIGNTDGLWEQVLTAKYLEQVFWGNSDAFRKFLESMDELREKGIGLRIEDTELEQFADLVSSTGIGLHPSLLYNLVKFTAQIPQLKPYFSRYQAGDRCPHGATIVDMIDISPTILHANAVMDVPQLSVDQLKTIEQSLDRNGLDDEWEDNESVSFLNTLKFSDILPRMNSDQIKDLVGWVVKWGNDSDYAATHVDEPHIRTQLETLKHINQDSSIEISDGAMISMFYRQKATMLAQMIGLINNPDLLNEISRKIDTIDQIVELEKDLKSLIKQWFPDLVFPDELESAP